jgi:uncharacterized protein YecE (DUF72 family)
MDGLRVGTCSWKYPSWAGIVYSRATGIDYLAEYSRRFDSVEVDQWFWALPERATAAEYAAATPPDFRFTIKLPNALSLTHFYRTRGETDLKPNPDFLSPRLFDDVLSRLEPLHGKIGMLMLQFEYLNRQKMPSGQALLEALARFADTTTRALPLGIELRNPRWLDARYFDFLKEHEYSHVFLQGYYMPPIDQTWAGFRDRLQGTVVVRLHGPDREGMEKLSGESWDRIIAPKDDELARLVAMINDMRGRSLTVYLNINNHYEGSAPLTVERLRERGLT